jgi:uncharacterized protein YkwD
MTSGFAAMGVAVTTIALGGCAGGMITGSTFPPAPGGISAAQAQSTVNAYRAAHGLPPVRVDAAVMRAARAQSEAMARLGAMSHEAGGDFRSRLSASGVGRAPAVENIAWGQRDFGEAMRSWQYSAKHAQNMRTPDLTRLGVAVVNGPSGPFWTLVMAGEAR